MIRRIRRINQIQKILSFINFDFWFLFFKILTIKPIIRKRGVAIDKVIAKTNGNKSPPSGTFLAW